ncbi:MAG TPA: Sir2 family NAD-dependent protein deacetylase, partial [Planctomycetota bacterium]|nr:Sir2 family NAD-dependent protein deacetylase [Planctomycetota bacterium]
PERTLQIHGNLHFARCAGGCAGPVPLPEGLGEGIARDAVPDDATLAALRCASCGGWLRPHVLWFDEYYDEENYRAETALSALAGAALLLVVGTSGATSLPARMVEIALAQAVSVVVVDPEPTSFAQRAVEDKGAFLRGTACAVVPQVVAALTAR